MPSTAPETIEVAAAALVSTEGRVLVSLRPVKAHQGGLWEFPGGKIETGETPIQALERELLEELGVFISTPEPLIRVRHCYDDKCVLLHVFRVRRFRGEPVGCEGQPLRWLYPEEMQPEDFPAADRPIITALRLPDACMITGADPLRPDRFLQRLEAVLGRHAGNLPLIQLRAPQLEPADFRGLARAVAARCRQAGARLILNTGVETAAGIDAAGVHLNRQRLMALTSRPVGFEGLIGASCHDAQELAHADRLGLDYAFLSPVQRTASHPQAEPLGWDQFAELVEGVSLPVYALGGMQLEDIAEARRHGGQGIATIRGLWPAG